MAREFPFPPDVSIVEATETAIANGTHLTPADAGAVAALRALAPIVDHCIRFGINKQGKFDNVSVPTYLKALDALGLTPAGRIKLTGPPKPESGGGKLAQLRSVGGPGRTG